MYKIESKSIFVIVCLSLLFSFPSLCIDPMENEYAVSFSEDSDAIPSAVVWKDNFSDGDISDWTVFGMNATTNPPTYNDKGDFSLDDGSLRANGTVINNAYIESTVAFGQWSFDVDVVDTPLHQFHVAFMSTTNYSNVWEVYDYALNFVTAAVGEYSNPTIELGWHRRTPSANGIDWDPFAHAEYPGGLDGWYHIDITRVDDYFFYVYVNGSYKFGLTHNTYTESETFHFWAPAGPAIDNVVIYDQPTIDKVPPVFSKALTDHSLMEGENFRYDVNATDSLGIDTATWAVNDTTNFAISSDGVITNAVALTAGTYGIEVSIDDTWGNTATGSFKVTVEAATTEPPDYTLIAVAGGLVVVVLIVAVVYLRKRGS